MHAFVWHYYRLLRAAVRVVIVFYTRPALAVQQRKLRTRDKEKQEWAGTLALYQVSSLLAVAQASTDIKAPVMLVCY